MRTWFFTRSPNDEGMMPTNPFVDDLDIAKRVSPDQNARPIQTDLFQRLSLEGQDQLRRRLDDVWRLLFVRWLFRDVFDQQGDALGFRQRHHCQPIDYTGPAARRRMQSIAHRRWHHGPGVATAAALEFLVRVGSRFGPRQRFQQELARQAGLDRLHGRRFDDGQHRSVT